MVWVAVAIGGSAILGAATSLIGSGQQADAANNAAGLQDKQFQQTRADYAPWRDAGGLAVKQQANLLGLNGADPQTNAFTQFREDPGYKYQVDQAVQGVDRSAAARGLTHSGAVIKAIQDRASNLADQGYSNYFNRLAGVAGTGQTATAGTASAGSSAATAGGNAMIAAGNARASGYSGVAKSLNQGAEGYLTNNYFNQLSGGGGGGGFATPYSGNGNGEFYGL